MFRYFLSVLFILITIFSTAHCKINTLLSDGDDLLKLRNEYQTNILFKCAVNKVINEANKYLNSPCYSVMEKKTFPPSKNKHDYMSLARYWWPNKNSKGKRSYVRKDGLINPEIWSDNYDYDKKFMTTEACKMLSYAYFFTRDERFAKSSAEKIKAWFLDPLTRMNPNMNYAQGVPGGNLGRPSGIIESSPFPFMFDAIRLLEGSIYWSTKDQENLEQWIKEYLEWLLTSPNGRKEAQAKNNHSTWYDFQVIYFAIYTNQYDFAKAYLIEHVYTRLQNQFSPIGSQPFELLRNKSFFYCYYNLYAFFCCALIGEHLNEDVWEITLGENATLRKALDWLLTFVIGGKTWINKDIEPINAKLLAPLLLIGAKVYEEPKYLLSYYQIMNDEIPCEIWRLFYPRLIMHNISSDSR